MSKGKLTIVQGDVTNPQYTAPNEVALICHVCNNGSDERGIGVMGAGVAFALRQKWPSVYDEYKKMEKEFPDGLKNRLGDVCFSKTAHNIIVANMIAQNNLVSLDNPIPLKYSALVKCMEKIRDRIKKSITPELIVIHAPKFGSKLAGGNELFIMELIREIWIENGISVVIYEFQK